MHYVAMQHNLPRLPSLPVHTASHTGPCWPTLAHGMIRHCLQAGFSDKKPNENKRW